MEENQRSKEYECSTVILEPQGQETEANSGRSKGSTSQGIIFQIMSSTNKP